MKPGVKRIDRSLREKLPALRAAEADVTALRKEYYRNKAHHAVSGLEKNGFSAHYADSTEEAREILLDLIPDGAVVGCGDSHTLFALHVDDILRMDKDCTVISHRCALNADAVEHPNPLADDVIGTKEEMRELLVNYLTSDVFLLGANAITLDGRIVNMDGRGNRVVGGIYGPGRIIVIAGANKVVPSMDAARERIGFTAAPINNLKYGADMPCLKAGKCMDCHHPARICNVMTVIHRCPENADYHVIVIGDELGF